MGEKEYIQQLEDTISKFLKPIAGIPYRICIRALTGHNVISFDGHNPRDLEFLAKLEKAATLAGKKANNEGIFRARPNEVGNDIEPYVREALGSVGLQAATPIGKQGRRQAAGYPDLEITDAYERTIYLECKTYNLRNINTTQRAFYFSPPTKVSKDALHLLLTYQIERATRHGRQAFVPVHWRIYTLEELVVDLKHEFNASNRQMYGRVEALLAESSL